MSARTIFVGLLVVLCAASPGAAAAVDLTIAVTARQDGTDTPLAGATVSVTASDGRAVTRTSDGTGTAVIAGLSRGRGTLTVSRPGWETVTRTVELADDAQTVGVALSRSVGRVTIAVVGADDGTTRPIPGCQVKVRAEDLESTSLPPTDAEGVVAADLPFGTLTVSAIAKGWETKVETLQLTTKQATLTITLRKQRPPNAEGAGN